MPQPQTWEGLFSRLIAGGDLDESDTAWAMDQVMSGKATPAQIGGFAIALRAKGETAAEIAGMASAMLDHSRPVHLTAPAVDVVGTGGDRSGTVNISTMSSLVVAAAGAPVVKHGNRSVSSKSGAGDVLEALGVTIETEPEQVQRCVTDVGIGFCYAPLFHPAFRHTGAPRRELGVPTTFNLLGPLTNPARPRSGLIGCAYPEKVPVLAEVFARRGDNALVVRGDDGLDEISTTTTSTIRVVSGGTVRTETFDPRELGIARASLQDLRGADADTNAAIARDTLRGEPGPVRDAVLINSAGALAAYAGFSSDLVDDLDVGLKKATDAIDSGAAADVLAAWAARS